MTQDNQNFDEVFDEITVEGNAAGSDGQNQSGAEPTPEEIRKKAHGADSMRGRLDKEKERARRLEEEFQKKAQSDSDAWDNESEPEKDKPASEEATGEQDDAPGPESKESPEQDKAEEPGSKNSEDQAIPEDLRKKAAEYELIVERLRAQQERNRQLESMLSQNQTAPGASATGKGPGAPRGQGPAYKKVAIPEDLTEDAKEFQDKYPDYYRYLEEDGPSGKRMREALREYGPEQAALVAETKMLRDEIEATRREAREGTTAITRKIQEDETRKHFDAVAEKHPEMAWKDTENKKDDWMSFIEDVRGWIETQPYRDAQMYLHVAEKGNTEQVIRLLDEYKAAKSSDQQGEADPHKKNNNANPLQKGPTAKDPKTPVSKNSGQQAREEKEEMIKAAEAVTSRPAPPRPPKPDPNDFDSAWDEAVAGKR